MNMRAVARLARSKIVRGLDAYSMRRLAAHDARLATALRTPVEAPIFENIERHRAEMLADVRPLVDGQYPHPGPFDADISVAEACAVSKPPKPSRVLHSIARVFKPSVAIELGTNVGISAAYIASGLNGGVLTTLEASPNRVAIAKNMHGAMGLTNIRYVQGLFSDTLTETLATLQPVEMAFIDGHHQYQPTLDYFNAIWQHSTEGAVFIFDDIRWSDGMAQCWRKIQHDPRVIVAADLWTVGVCITTCNGSTKTFRTAPMRTVFR
jgi:predicted O-methyltransferase YrrM